MAVPEACACCQCAKAPGQAVFWRRTRKGREHFHVLNDGLDVPLPSCDGAVTEACPDCNGHGFTVDDMSDWPDDCYDTPKAWPCDKCGRTGRVPA